MSDEFVQERAYVYEYKREDVPVKGNSKIIMQFGEEEDISAENERGHVVIDILGE